MRLREMNASEYAEFVPMQVAEFALQMTFAGEWELDDALDKSLARSEWLFDGSAIASGHRFFRAFQEGVGVGWLWEGPPPIDAPGRWLYQITIEETMRGGGHGDAALACLERMLSREGVGELRLNVFRWNEAALGLYEKRGYAVVAEFPLSLHLRKALLTAGTDGSL